MGEEEEEEEVGEGRRGRKGEEGYTVIKFFTNKLLGIATIAFIFKHHTILLHILLLG